MKMQKAIAEPKTPFYARKTFSFQPSTPPTDYFNKVTKSSKNNQNRRH